MPQIIKIDVSPAGDVKVDAQGFTGQSCADATKGIELVLGGGEAKKDKKPEWYAPATTGNTHVHKGF